LRISDEPPECGGGRRNLCSHMRISICAPLSLSLHSKIAKVTNSVKRALQTFLTFRLPSSKACLLSGMFQPLFLSPRTYLHPHHGPGRSHAKMTLNELPSARSRKSSPPSDFSTNRKLGFTSRAFENLSLQMERKSPEPVSVFFLGGGRGGMK
jgi:hypothetical protein